MDCPYLAVLAVCIGIVGSLFSTARGEAKDGAARTSVTSLVRKRLGKVDSIQVNTFFGDFTGDGRDDALTVTYYHTPDGGNSDSIDVSLYEGSANGFRFLKTVDDVFGQSPRGARFGRGQVRITLTTLGPDDARCCPSVPKQYVIAAP